MTKSLVLIVLLLSTPTLACKMAIVSYSRNFLLAGMDAFIADHDRSATITDVQLDDENIVNVRGVLNKAVVGAKYKVSLKTDCSTTTIPVEY